jgi:uncharacterized protein (TIGR02145 family)
MEACPYGWHLPSHLDWDNLSRAAGGERGHDKGGNFLWNGADGKLKAKSGWKWDYYKKKSGNGTDDYGFSALSGGYYAGYFGNVGQYGYWWTAEEFSGGNAYSRVIGYGEINERNDRKSNGYSVRCVEGEAVAPAAFLLTLKAGVGGTVSGNRKKSYFAGEQVSISASPDSGYTFVRWVGGQVADDTSAAATVTVNSNMSVTAVFRATPPVVYGTLIDKRDGKTYTTVNIGGKTWMAENLNYKTDSSWCYENKISNCAQYGRLYAWNAATRACPSGWHLSNKDDWEQLCRTSGGKSVYNDNSTFNCEGAGTKLKSRTGWKKQYCAEDGCTNGMPGKDNYGFSALPGGVRYYDGKFEEAGYEGIWWTPVGIRNSDMLYNSDTYYRSMVYDREIVIEDYEQHIEDDGLSVRCIAD